MLQKLWDMVNGVETLNAVKKAEKVLMECKEISNDDFDELMMALSYISRELYRR